MINLETLCKLAYNLDQEGSYDFVQWEDLPPVTREAFRAKVDFIKSYTEMHKPEIGAIATLFMAKLLEDVPVESSARAAAMQRIAEALFWANSAIDGFALDSEND